jgi:esterase/lipase
LFVGLSVGGLVGLSVGPHITLNVIFSAVCGQIDLKFGRDLYVGLLFQFLLFFFLNSSSNSSFSSEIKLIYDQWLRQYNKQQMTDNNMMT